MAAPDSFDVTAEPAAFDEAAEWFRKRQTVSRDQLESINEWAQARAFWISEAMCLSLVDEARQTIDRGIVEGWDRKRLGREISKRFAEFSDSRCETIARTNVQRAYTAGRWQQLEDPDVVAVFPFRVYDAIVDFRTTDTCRERDGTTLPWNDQWWLKNYPPLHHRCRAMVRTADEDDYEATPPEKRQPNTIHEIRDGFGAAPVIDQPWRPQLGDYPPDLAAEYQRHEVEHLEIEREQQAARENAARRARERKAQAEREAQANPFTRAELEQLDQTKARDVTVLDDADETRGAKCSVESDALASELSRAESEAVKAFSRGYDATIRRIQLEEPTDAELFEWRRAHVLATGSDETKEETRTHIRDARRYAGDVAGLLDRLRGRKSSVRYVYRGIGGLTGEDVRKLLAAGEFDMRGQTSSTSWQPAVAEGFERQNAQPGRFGIVLKLKTRSGVAIETISEVTPERELLLRGDARFKVVRVTRYDRVGEAPGEDAGTLLVEAEEIEA